eukprot:2391421-Amphidinium_carterae.1
MGFIAPDPKASTCSSSYTLSENKGKQMCASCQPILCGPEAQRAHFPVLQVAWQALREGPLRQEKDRARRNFQEMMLRRSGLTTVGKLSRNSRRIERAC